jgi:hypothetical protein
MTRPQKLEMLEQYLCNNFYLTPIEAKTLVSFKATSRQFNAKIRNNELSPNDCLFRQQLHSALNKLPSTKQSTIYRNLSFLDCQLSKASDYFKLGVKIRFREFLSCTIRECFTGNSSDYNCIIAIIPFQKSQAKDIYSLWDKFDLNDAEKEVIYISNSCFEILEIKYMQRRLELKVNEIEPDKTILPVPEF